MDLPTTKVTYRLPEILSRSEVETIIQSCVNIKHKTLLMVIYSAGLRVSEAVALRMSDIDSDRMTLHLRDCKNGRDRYVMLSKRVYQQLRQYWKACHFNDYLFPRQGSEQPITAASASAIYKKAKQQAGIQKAGGIHALRHAFATHMLESGHDLFVIKELLGHRCIQSTARYLNFVPNRGGKITLPIDAGE